MVSELGLSHLFYKEYPFKKDNHAFLSAMLMLRLFALGICTMLSFSLYLFISDPTTRSILILVQGFMFFNKATDIGNTFLHAKQKMGQIAIGNIINTGTTTALGIYILIYYPNLTLFTTSYLIAAIFRLLWTFIRAKPYFPPTYTHHPTEIKRILKEVLPFWFTLTAGLLYVTADALMIKWLYNAEALGIYKAVIKQIGRAHV